MINGAWKMSVWAGKGTHPIPVEVADRRHCKANVLATALGGMGPRKLDGALRDIQICQLHVLGAGVGAGVRMRRCACIWVHLSARLRSNSFLTIP